ncbi:hypothetical protein KR009_000084, partial [Drosophila setifemur]
APLSDWPPESLNLGIYISPLDDTALIMPRGFCAEKSLVLIVVESVVDNFLERQAIRETWGNTSRFNYPDFARMHGHLNVSYYPALKSRIQLFDEYLSGEGDNLRASISVVFIVGRSKFSSPDSNNISRQLHVEADRYNDIIQEDFIDTYNNLTLKTILALKHVTKKCSRTTAFFFKTDDDAFVNVPNLLHILLGGTLPVYRKQIRLTDTSGVMVGYKFDLPMTTANADAKSYIPYYMYPHNILPEYVSGGGYLLTMDVVQRLYEAAWTTKLIHLEDVYLGACAQRAEIKPVNSFVFSVFFSKFLCNYKNTVVRSSLRISNLKRVWDFVSDYSIKCFP